LANHSGGPPRKKFTGGKRIIAVILVVVMVGGIIGYALTRGSASSPERPVNLLTNGGFETGNLQGWQTVPPHLPTVESSVVENGSSSYAARFQTPTNDAKVSSPCLIGGVGCGSLNASTIYQNVYNVTVSEDAKFSLAVYPMFQYPSAFQVALEFGLSSATSRANSTDVIIYYLVLASPQQCVSYSQDLVNAVARATSAAAAHCLAARQGNWTLVSRDLATDLPSGIGPSDLRGSLLTVSISFAGAGSTDVVYVDSLFLA
jgi:hypothetical protein